MPKRKSTNPLSPDSIPLQLTKSKLKEKVDANDKKVDAIDVADGKKDDSNGKKTSKKPENLEGIFKFVFLENL